MNVELPIGSHSLRKLAIQALERHCEAAREGAWPAFDANIDAGITRLRENPPTEDERLVRLADRLGLSDAELATAALCLAGESDPHFARLIAQAQEPVGASRPMVGLASTLFTSLGLSPPLLAAGRGIAAGLFVLGDEPRALPERSLSIPLPLIAALVGEFCLPPAISPLSAQSAGFTSTQRERMDVEADWLSAEDDGPRTFVLRTPSRREALAGAATIAARLNKAPVLLAPEDVARQAIWLMAADTVPCIELALGPGETRRLPPFGIYSGPVLCLLGPEGSIESGVPQREWTVPLPGEAERALLWQDAGLDAESASLAARGYRQGAGRIAELAEQARNGSPDGAVSWDGVCDAVRRGRSALDGLAHGIHARVEREELILPADALAALDLLLARILNRDSLTSGLGAAIRSRYGPGVRALFAGEPGTGKTLAAHWLAVQTGLPLYRVDLAALTSKWIGETEKNLSAILDAAQHADVILLFDEADALFGKRTDVSDAHDRHANAQTNYLLQRIEDFEGVVILATNVRDNMDAAFARRLDMILPFPMPDPAARFDLWRGHLGRSHTLTDAEIGALSVGVELTGGHIRNVVLGAAVRARLGNRTIALPDVIAALHDEYGKLGRAAPALAI